MYLMPETFVVPVFMMVSGILEAVFSFLGFLFAGLGQMFLLGGQF